MSDQEVASVSTEQVVQPKLRKKGGFAKFSPEQVRAWGSLGGKNAHASGAAKRWTTDEARANASKGGRAIAAKRANAKLVATTVATAQDSTAE